MTQILKPITDTLDQLISRQNQVEKVVKVLAEREQAPLLPKEVTALLPKLLEGVIKIFTTPETSAGEASKGIFGEKMREAYEKSMIAQWDIGTRIAEANLAKINLDNALMAKRLKEEI